MRAGGPDLLLQERPQWLLWWPVGLGVGIALYMSLFHEPPIFLTAIIGFLALMGCGALLYFVPRTHVLAATSIPFFLHGLCAVVFGFSVAQLRTVMLNTPLLDTWLKQQEVTGVIESVEKNKDDSKKTRFILGHLTPDLPFKKARVFLSGKAHDEKLFLAGQKIQCPITFWPIPKPITLTGYDPQFVSYFAGIGAYGRITKPCQFLEKTPESWLAETRGTITQRLRSHMPGNSGHMAAALITGDRSGIPDTIRQQFADSGTAHILAISGIHVSLLAGLVFLVLRRGLVLFLQESNKFCLKKLAAILSIPVTVFYVAISGFGIPAIRALVMTTIIMMGIVFDRNPISLRSLSFAAVGVLLIFPESLFSVSFQLSFAAVTGLVAFYELVKGKIIKGFWFYVVSLVVTTIIATLSTMPFIISTFNRVTLQAITGNLVAIPLVGIVIMPSLMIALISLLFGGWSWAFGLCDLSLKALIGYAQWVASLPGAVMYVKTPAPAALILFVFGFLWLCLWRKKWRFIGIPIIVAAFIMGATYSWLPTAVVDKSAKIILYEDNGILWVSNPKRGRFFQKQWAQVYGNAPIQSWGNDIYEMKTLHKNYVLDPQNIRRTMYFWKKKDHVIVVSQSRILGKRPWRK